MSLIHSQVYKCLEKKTLILGFEVIDLFIMSLLLCVLNFIFADSNLKLFFTFGPVGILAILFRVMKIGKAENYLLHLIKFQFTPGIYQAWTKTTNTNQLLKIKQKAGFKYAGFKSSK